VAIHAVDRQAAGLRDLGRPDGFLRRQLDRLPQLVAEADGSLPAPFGELRDRLRATMPVSGEATLVHGDFRLGNVMLARQAPVRVLGVLDWELAGIGDPLADLAYTLATYAVPDEPLHALTALSTATRADGFPTRDGLARRYAAATGRDLTRLPWYEAFQLFKLALLFEYNHRRTLTYPDGDPYYADPQLVRGLLEASRRAYSHDPAGTD
jgi:aminoglycoside phosphotransferase (APT) family kinase protein